MDASLIDKEQLLQKKFCNFFGRGFTVRMMFGIWGFWTEISDDEIVTWEVGSIPRTEAPICGEKVKSDEEREFGFINWRLTLEIGWKMKSHQSLETNVVSKYCEKNFGKNGQEIWKFHMMEYDRDGGRWRERTLHQKLRPMFRPMIRSKLRPMLISWRQADIVRRGSVCMGYC